MMSITHIQTHTYKYLLSSESHIEKLKSLSDYLDKAIFTFSFKLQICYFLGNENESVVVS